MKATKTSALWAKHHQQWSDNYDELTRVANEEFPPGTKVEFPYGMKTITGIVMDVGGYRSTTVRVRSLKSRAEHRVECQHLRPLDEASSAPTPDRGAPPAHTP